ncbi:MAG: glycoside hydrolase family 16 protein [Saprospiraceae bacterium]|nr:glycoside hydrolase family 16 protein [Bacteroidia bacterium]NNE15796.1 glycoside hydrolase family 16 protein [Saprospiraceae bacterium]NNL90889.1 glycoside hydrolase family 16 protein [Saprospiraceae bacterium]
MRFNSPLYIKSAFFICLVFLVGSCTDTTELKERSWDLVWEDNFDGDAGTQINTNNWGYDLGRGPNGDGWGNAELQTYTNDVQNVSLDGQGNLMITARNNGGFTSGRILTKGLFDQAFGRFEARIKLPYGQGIWPAFWMLGSNIDVVGWPQCGEIDVLELKGQEPSVIHGSLHGPGYSGGNPISKSYGLNNDRFDLEFHNFAIEWDENSINYIVDDVIYQRITKDDVPGEWVYDQPFHILLNVAVGGNYVGFPAANTPFPQTMYVDFVKVFKEIN